MKRIDKYINEEKSTLHSAQLERRIMSRLALIEEDTACDWKKQTGWRSLGIAASIAIVITAGIAIGGSYMRNSIGYAALMINDKHIENLSDYTANEE